MLMKTIEQLKNLYPTLLLNLVGHLFVLVAMSQAKLLPTKMVVIFHD
jgi:hypothetical protein